MGTFSVTFEVGSPDRQTWRSVEALVDTGATFTWLPQELLSELGHVPVSRKTFEIGDGSTIDRDIGECPIRIGNDVRTTVCVFATPNEKPVLGAMTLEAFLLAPDPINLRLMPVPGLRVSARLVEGGNDETR